MIRLGDRDPELLDMWFDRRARERDRLASIAVPTPATPPPSAPVPPPAPAGGWASGFAGALAGSKV